MDALLPLLAGLLIGCGSAVAIALLLQRRWQRQMESVRQELEEADAERRAELLDNLKATFGSLSREALSQNTSDFLQVAKTTLGAQTAAGEQKLEEKKRLIDTRLEQVTGKLGELTQIMNKLEQDRAASSSALRTHMAEATKATLQLQQTTGHLREALANTKLRGQWGERMAEDVLRLAGFQPGVNYRKQATTESGKRPDYSFPLPDQRVLNMDVKFPLENYLKMLDAGESPDAAQWKTKFLRDVRSRIREITTKDYIDPAAGTLDFVLIFIPNEQVFAFILETDPLVLDDAARSGVVLCGPMSLYALLLVIRQAADNFRVERSARQILDLLAEFKKQWTKYVEVMDAMGKKLGDARAEFDKLVGVRTRQLDRQLERIEDLQAQGTTTQTREISRTDLPLPNDAAQSAAESPAQDSAND